MGPAALLIVLAAAVAVAQALDPSLLWGTFRPQIYFGLRTSMPRSILSGLLWFEPSSPKGLVSARHDCSDDHNMNGYGWKYHDGRTFGVQEIKDVEFNYLIETSWLKTGNGSWAARIKGSVLDSREWLPNHFFTCEGIRLNFVSLRRPAYRKTSCYLAHLLFLTRGRKGVL